MAPPPEYDKEPKAPDKSATTIANDDSKLLHNSVNDQQTNSDHKTTNTAANTEVENNKQVVNLDDGQLRALLDEAMNYKCPKDLEGKSNLFKELLEEVEQQDDQASEAAVRGAGGCRPARRGAGGGGAGGARSRHALHSNSLQDLVAALAAESAPRRPRHHATAPAPVSARAIQGGSLPSGVDTSFLLGEEGGGARYLATVRCVNPPPLAERRVSASDANCPQEVEPLNARRSKPVFPMTYTARATLEIGSGSVCSGRAVTTTTASNQGDSAIPFSCITTPEVVASCNTTSSTPQTTVAVDPKPLQPGCGYRAGADPTGASSAETDPDPAPAPAPAPLAPLAPPAARQLQVFVPRLGLQPRSVISSSFNGLPLTRPGFATAPATDEYKKSLDENGNAVQGFSSPVSGSGQHKKPRRKKSSKNETVIKSHQIDGYQGNKDLNEVLRFIESNADAGRGKLAEKGKKRSTERRKEREKPKRASSLEERSRTTLEDLTAPRARAPPPPVSATATKPERRSWGDDARPAFYFAPDPPAPPAPPDPAPELTDFQTVTKRRKPRRRADDGDREPPRRPRPASPSRPRRESAPPSDRSNDSNDDLDSVHSLAAPPAPPAPHASYADIARTRHNIPDLIESCNFYAEGEEEAGVAVARGDAEYPALGPRARPAVKQRPQRKERPPPPPAQECPAPDVVGDRRPAVILLDSGARPRDMDGVTFGFDINEQLLTLPPRRPRCDLVRDAIELEPGATATAHEAVSAGRVSAVGMAAVGVAAVGVAVGVAACALRYVPPAPPPDTAHLHQIVDYVGNAWEDVVRCGGGKVRYFSE